MLGTDRNLKTLEHASFSEAIPESAKTISEYERGFRDGRVSALAELAARIQKQIFWQESGAPKDEEHDK